MDQIAQAVLDFVVSGNRRFSSINWVRVDIMAAAMSLQITARIDEFSQELVSFHRATSICLV